MLKQRARRQSRTPASPDDFDNFFGQVAERELRAQADDFVPAAQAAGAPVVYDKRPGVHDWPYWRQYLRDAIAACMTWT